MENNQKWINLSYIAVAMLLAFVIFLLAQKFSVALDFEGRVRSLEMILKVGASVIGVLTFVILNRSTRANTFMNEVVVELSKVTWPTQDETVKATIAVLIAVLIAGIVLWLVDSLWVYLLKFVI